MTDLPAPPWRTVKRSRPARQPLSQDVIVDVALRLLDREGLDGVSMRRIAQELDTGPASLYAHVANKDELLELMVDRVGAGITVPPPDPARWREQVKDVARQTYRAYVAHTSIAHASLAHIPTGPNTLRVSEGLLAILSSAGVPPQPAGWFLDRLFLYIAGDAYEGALYAARVRATGQDVAAYWESMRKQLGAFFASLPSETFPHITAHADAMLSGDGDERFEFGLDMLVNGIASYAERP